MKKLVIPESVYKISFPLIAITAMVILSLLKIHSFHAWQYTSDLFYFNQFLDEIVFNGQPVDFRYGNQLGDHAYLFLYLLAPLKYLLRGEHIYLLLLLNPLLYLASALLLFSLARKMMATQNAFFLSLAYLAGFGVLYQGLLEGIYAFHPDIGAGFILIAATFSFMMQDRSNPGQQGWQILGVVLSILYIMIKEETAILSILYFLIIFLATRKKYFLLLSVGSSLATGIGFYIIRISTTAFNRTNTSLVRDFFSTLRSNGLSVLYTSSRWPQSTVIAFWVFIFVAVVLFHGVWLSRRLIAPFSTALFYCGLVKMGFSILLFDFRPTSWHNLPGIFMILAALLVIAMKGENQPATARSAIILAILVISTTLFTISDLPFLYRRYLDNRNRMEFVEKYTVQLGKLSDQIPEGRIVSVPMFSAVELVDHRITFYPEGVFTSPIGIADYVIFPVKISHIFTGNYEKLYPIETLSDGFRVIQSTNNFKLYQRVSLTPEEKTAREAFFQLGHLENLNPLPK